MLISLLGGGFGNGMVGMGKWAVTLGDGLINLNL